MLHKSRVIKYLKYYNVTFLASDNEIILFSKNNGQNATMVFDKNGFFVKKYNVCCAGIDVMLNRDVLASINTGQFTDIEYNIGEYYPRHIQSRRRVVL